MKTKERGREKRRRRKKGCTQLTSIKEQERREEEKEKTGVTDDDGCKETEEECWGEDEVSDGRIDDACLATLPFPARDSLSYSPTYLPTMTDIQVCLSVFTYSSSPSNHPLKVSSQDNPSLRSFSPRSFPPLSRLHSPRCHFCSCLLLLHVSIC